MQIFRVGEIAIGKTWAQDLFISQTQREIINRLFQDVAEYWPQPPQGPELRPPKFPPVMGPKFED